MTIERRNRSVLGLLGLLLLAGGVLSVLLGAGVFGSGRSKRHVVDSTVIRWWNQPGWISFAVVVLLGLLLLVVGLRLVLSQFRRNDGKSRTPTITFPPSGPGETSLRSPALSHGLERDLQTIPDVHGAAVGLFGRFPEIELRAVIDVGDGADLDRLPSQVDEVLNRLWTTTGIRPDPIQITVRFKEQDRQRQLV